MSRKIYITIIVLAVGVLGFLIINIQDKPKNISEPTAAVVNIQIGLEKESYSVGENIVFTSFIKNTSQTEKTYSFNSTCTEGTLFIDEQPTQIVKVCGQAITDIELRPSSTLTYNYEFTLVDSFSYDVNDEYLDYSGELKLTSGMHQAHLEWQDFRSGSLSFNIN